MGKRKGEGEGVFLQPEYEKSNSSYYYNVFCGLYKIYNETLHNSASLLTELCDKKKRAQEMKNSRLKPAYPEHTKKARWVLPS